MPEKRRTNIYIDEDVWKQAKHVCIDLNISFSELIEKLLMEYIEKHQGEKD